MKALYAAFLLFCLLLSACSSIEQEESKELLEAFQKIEENIELADSTINKHYEEEKTERKGPLPADEYSFKKTGKFYYFAHFQNKTENIWMVFKAKNKDAITAKYPELKVYENPPESLPEEEQNGLMRKCLENNRVWDIDDKPSGWLKKLIDKRK